MEIVKINTEGPFSTTECPKGMKKWTLRGIESPIMAKGYNCRVCKFHVFLPLAGKKSFGCTFI